MSKAFPWFFIQKHMQLGKTKIDPGYLEGKHPGEQLIDDNWFS